MEKANEKPQGEEASLIGSPKGTDDSEEVVVVPLPSTLSDRSVRAQESVWPVPIDATTVVIETVTVAAEKIADEAIRAVTTEVKEKLADMGLSPGTLHIVIRYVMEAVEKTPTKGKAQKDFALRVIDELVEELPPSGEKTLLETLSQNGGIGNTIDLVIAATKGELDINNVVDVVANNCLLGCIQYITSKCAKRPTGPRT
jgi:hypothetical protein